MATVLMTMTIMTVMLMMDGDVGDADYDGYESRKQKLTMQRGHMLQTHCQPDYASLLRRIL